MATITTHHEGGSNQYHARGNTPNHADKEEGINFFTLCDRNIREEYKKVFGEAVKDYNEQQVAKGHSERQIKDYYQKVKNDKKKHESYEAIIGVYGAAEEDAIDILKEVYNTWEEQNPNMHLVGFYIHADEESVNGVHAHAIYFPKYEAQKGLSVQNGINKACEQMGFKMKTKDEDGKWQTPQTQWEQSQNAYLEKLCNERGISVEHPQRGKNAEHLSVEAYKLNQQINTLKEAINKQKKTYDAVQQNIEDSQKVLDYYDKAIESRQKQLEEMNARGRKVAENCKRFESLRQATAEKFNEMLQTYGAFDDSEETQKMRNLFKTASEVNDEVESGLGKISKQLKPKETETEAEIFS